MRLLLLNTACAPHALAKVFDGMCTTYMQQLAVGSSVVVIQSVPQFKLPKQLNCPGIMIGVVCSTCLSTAAFFCARAVHPLFRARHRLGAIFGLC